MANIYIRSSDGSNTDNGSTWALAKATFVGAAGIEAAGDTMFFSSSHAESGGAISASLSVGTPVRMLSVDDSAEPPTALQVGAVIQTTGAFNVFSGYYAYGITIRSGFGSSSASTNLQTNGSGGQVLEKCKLHLASTGASTISAGASGLVRWIDVDVKFASTGQTITPSALHWCGGSLESGGASITDLFKSFTGALVENVDLTNLPTTANICSAPGASGFTQDFVIRNCRLPASWSGQLVGTIVVGAAALWRASMYNCDNADTNYRLWIETYAGSIRDETTVVKTGGATDGDTPLSWRFTTRADAAAPVYVIRSDEIVRWNDTVGSPITVEVDIVTDNVTLKDDEAWLDVVYLGTSGNPIGSRVSDFKADVLATAADQATSTATWTTTGLTTPVKQKLSVTFTPQEKGFIHATVHLAKPSTTVYVDPKLTVS